ncbi:MAG TPA: spondin domain-containing protein [Dongiaceae bacterium]|jgi:hypothetical protein|nr:spondin domain-containing protein [Dongiaceae bacterium]
MKKAFVLGGVLCALCAGAMAQTVDTELKPATFTVTVENVSGDQTLVVPGHPGVKAVISPGVYAVGRPLILFRPGKTASKESGIRDLCEDGNLDRLLAYAKAQSNAVADMFVPGQSFTITAKPGDRLAIATMFVQSNDKCYGFRGGALRLFDKKGQPISGDITKSIILYDIGTERDEQPGLGPNQAPRQKAAHTGMPENEYIAPAHDGFTYPSVKNVLKVTVIPTP